MAQHTADSVLPMAAAGDLVLFLGAGAVFGSTVGSQRRPALLGNTLRDELQRRFFPEERATTASLKQICSSIQNLKGVDKLREALTDLLLPVNPSKALLEIPRVQWRAIYSVNVDDSVERAYEATSNIVQSPRTVVLPYDVAAHDPTCEVSYYKLHGCLRRPESTLIFSHRDYTEAREVNLRMFTSLSRDLCDAPFLFVGFSFEDDDFRDIWQSVLRYLGTQRRLAPTFLVIPRAPRSFVDSMEVEGITVLDFDVEHFFPWLRANLPKSAPSTAERIHERVAPSQTLIQQTFGKTIEDNLLDQIRNNFDLVRQLPQTNKDPTTSRFLLGAYPSWADIQLGFPIRRELEQDLLEEFENWRVKPSFKMGLVTGGAGYGKSTLLMQLAHHIAKPAPGVEVLCKKLSGDLNAVSVAEYAQAIGVPVLLIVDDAFHHHYAMRRLKEACEQNSLPVFLLAASRPADWNRARKAGMFDISRRFDLPRLSKDESRELAKTMRRFGHLNSILQAAPIDELAEHFFEHSDKHLLAGLLTAAVEGEHEFERIITDEYFRIPGGKPQNLYLNVSLVHSLGLPTPASLACASVDLALTDYHQTHASVLDTTLIEYQDDVSRDLMFTTQHRVVAEALIAKVLRPSDAVDRILALAIKINPHYREQYNILLRLYDEDYLSSILNNPATVRSCYEQLLESFPADAFIKQHFGIFESHGKNFVRAHHLIDEALQLRPRDAHFLNTKANILLREATATDDKARAENLFLEGTKLLRERIEKDADKEIHYLSLTERQLEWARRRDLTREQRLNILEEAESDLGHARRRYPFSSDISTVAAKLMLALRNIPDAKSLLERSVRLDGANIRARVLLARILIEGQQRDEALQIISGGLINFPKDFGLLRLRLDCLRALARPWAELKSALSDYLSIAENDFVERIYLIKGLLENGDLAGATRQLDKLKRTEAPYFALKKNLVALRTGDKAFVVEGEYQPSSLGKGYMLINGYPKHLGAYIDLRMLAPGTRLSAGKKLRAELGINGFGLVVTKLL